MLIVSCLGIKKIGFEFAPQQEADAVTLEFKLPLGTTYEVTRDFAEQIKLIVEKEVRGYEGIMVKAGGSSSMLGSAESNYGEIMIRLPDWDLRIDRENDIKEKLRKHFDEFPNAKFSFGTNGGGMGSAKPIEFVIKSNDMVKLLNTSKQIKDLIKEHVPEATEPDIDMDDGLPQWKVVVDREKAYIVGVGCKGKLDIEKAKQLGIKGIESVSGAEMTDEADALIFQTLYGEKSCSYAEAMLERCHVCKGKEHVIYDELIGESKDTKDAERFAEVEKIEAMCPSEKFAFFQKELSKCIRCNACRNVCPACSCRKCVFDSTKFDSDQKANVDSFEEKMFHIIRAFHVAGRCTDCGECSRVCPQGIPLHLFNRKFIKDINELYGDFQAGADSETRGPLTNFTFDDAEPSIVTKR